MKSKIMIACALFSLFFSCKKTETEELVKKLELNGVAQKGPFINGSSIIISELDDKLIQTGRAFTTTIGDNTGKFELKNVELVSKYAALRADGFYFNENSGSRSSAQLTLNGLAEITDASSVNINVLTHLEKGRIEHLVSQKQLSFKEAKTQAQKEILKIFGFEKSDIQKSEQLSLAKDGDDNAILFAISVILQGYRTTPDMSELIADIVTDLKEDGELTSTSLGSKLIEDAQLLDLAAVRLNLENRYKDLGVTAQVPNFEKYVRLFIQTTKFQSTKSVEYPISTSYGLNILHDQLTKITLPKEKEEPIPYSMAANLPMGTNLKIVLKGGGWAYRVSPNGPVNWNISLYADQKQTFTAVESGKSSDVNLQFSMKGTVLVEYYENNATTPTKVKYLVVE